MCEIGSGRLGLTVEWAIGVLEEGCAEFQAKLAKGRVVEKITSTQLSSDQGFMSEVYRCDVHFKDCDEKLAFCLKEPSSDRMDKILGTDFYPLLCRLHSNECQFYETFVGVQGLNIPRVYAMKELSADDRNGYIFMDFAGQGQAKPISLERSLSEEQILAVAEQIAHLHAHALKNKRPWEGRFPSVNIVATSREECSAVFERIIGSLRKFCDDEILNSINELGEVLRSVQMYERIVFKCHLEAGVPSIPSHGDLWANNLLFQLDASGELTAHVSGIVDWQAANAGNPAQDLVRIMLMNMDGEQRHRCEQTVFEHYYGKLGEYLEELGAPSPPPFTLEQLREAARPYFIYQLVLMMFIAAHNFEDPKRHNERAVFVERLRVALRDARKSMELWHKLM